jgi:dTMP kinase
MSGMTEVLLYAAARAQHVAEVIKPALEQGRMVLCDRFIDSSLAYQGYARKIGAPVKIINEFAVDGLMPDVTFLLKLSPEMGKSRIAAKNKDRLESEDTDFYIEVAKGYDELERAYPDRIIGIDASGSIEVIHDAIKSRLDALFKA